MKSKAIKCVACDKPATTTAAHIPVCDKHWNKYKNEADAYPVERPFYMRLIYLDMRNGISFCESK